MKTDETGIEFIGAFEGCILQAYDDADDRIVKPGQLVHGTLTVGEGHTSAAGPPRVYVGMKLKDKAEADAILASDLASVDLEIAHLVKVQLNQNQWNALSSFQYNTGWLAHPQCSLLKAINSGNFDLAEKDFGLYDEASGKVLSGLKRRREAEALMFNGKIDQALALAKQ